MSIQLPARARFPQRVRVQRKQDFERVRAQGQVWRHPLFVLSAGQNEQTISRIGIIAGRKMGNAVQRNRAKRLLREAARRLYGQLAPGWDIVLIARADLSMATMWQVYAALTQVAHRAGLLIPGNEEPCAHSC